MRPGPLARRRWAAELPSAAQSYAVGRLVEKKGVTFLLRALVLVRGKFPNIHLSIIGDGPLRQKLAQQATELGITDNLSFHGSVIQADLPRFYSRAAIAIIPSVVADSGDQEGLGLVTVEALGCGCAVVASDLPAIRDVIDPGENGLLAEPADANSIAEKIIYLLENEPHRFDIDDMRFDKGRARTAQLKCRLTLSRILVP